MSLINRELDRSTRSVKTSTPRIDSTFSRFSPMMTCSASESSTASLLPAWSQYQLVHNPRPPVLLFHPVSQFSECRWDAVTEPSDSLLQVRPHHSHNLVPLT